MQKLSRCHVVGWFRMERGGFGARSANVILHNALMTWDGLRYTCTQAQAQHILEAAHKRPVERAQSSRNSAIHARSGQARARVVFMRTAQCCIVTVTSYFSGHVRCWAIYGYGAAHNAPPHEQASRMATTTTTTFFISLCTVCAVRVQNGGESG